MATMAQNRQVKVEITPNPKAKNGYDFKLDGPGVTSDDEIKFENFDNPGYVVYFKIKDVHQTGLRFRPDAEDALWVNAGLGNPPPDSQWPGFVPLSVENDEKKLIVYCRNKLPKQKFKFTLRFLGPNGPIDWDPIGDGLNGPRGSFS